MSLNLHKTSLQVQKIGAKHMVINNEDCNLQQFVVVFFLFFENLECCLMLGSISIMQF